MKQNEHSYITSEGNLTLTVWRLAWPIIVEMMLMTLVGIVDMAMVGSLGPAAIAATGIGGQVVMFSTTAFVAIRTGTTALVARHIGAGEKEEAELIARQSVVMSAFISILNFVLLNLFAEGALKLLGAAPEVISLGATYIRYRAIGMVFDIFTMIFNAILRGIGDTKTPMVVNSVISLVNPVLNYIFIFGNFGAPKMGVGGAALASSIAMIIGFFISVYIVTSGGKAIQLSIRDDYSINWPQIKRVLNIGIPAMIEQLSMRGAQMFYTMILTSLGTVVYAAHQVAIRAESLSFLPGMGLGMAATTLVAQNLGAKEPERAERGGYTARNLGLVFASFMGIVFFFFPEFFVRIFSQDSDVIREGANVLRMVAIAQPSTATNLILAGSLRGAGDTRWVTYITAFSVWFIRLTVAYYCVFVLHWGLVGAWMGMIADIIIRSILLSWRFARGKWKTLKV